MACRQSRAPVDARNFHGADDLWRIRVGSFRIVYRIDDTARLIEIRTIGDRKDVYG